MPIYDDDDKDITNLEGFSKYIETQEMTKKRGMKDKLRTMFAKIPFFSISLLVLIIIVGAIALSLNFRLSVLSKEIEEAKGAKAQLSAMQAGIDKKFDVYNKEREGLKSEMSRLRSELETMKNTRRRVEAEDQKAAAAAAAKKKAPAKKVTPKEKPRTRP
ncbi:MAG: hypothetical protein C0392_10920 [Syntrophus sp. (in: bacteria)]|nr:hypothetical protein [Syntrophus sp. (in: bacteria)]